MRKNSLTGGGRPALENVCFYVLGKDIGGLVFIDVIKKTLNWVLCFVQFLFCNYKQHSAGHLINGRRL